MIAAIYARKSTEQRTADDEAKSVPRQIENARAFAASKGWRVDDTHIYNDDGISGAEVRKPGKPATPTRCHRHRASTVSGAPHARFLTLQSARW